MTDPNQPQWQQPNSDQGQPGQQGQPDQQGVPPVPSAPPVAPQQPAFGAYAGPGQNPPSAEPFAAPAPGQPAPYGQPQDQPNPYGQPSTPNPYGAQGPYAGQQYAPAGPVPMSWRSIVSFPLSLIAILFFPPLFGGAAIVLASLAMRRKEKGALVALIIAVAATVIGLILGAVVASQNL